MNYWPPHEQLPLQIRLRDDAILESYFPGINQHAFWAVKQMSQGLGDPFIYLWGQTGTGRTHLLQAACQEVTKQGHSAVYLPLNSLNELHAGVLQGLEQVSLICVDDLEYALGQRAWEEALLHLFNRTRDGNGRLLMAANQSANQLPIGLADLKSRLCASMAYQLSQLNEDERLYALQLRAQTRGLHMNAGVGRFLLKRTNDDMHQLFRFLETLDEASLAEKHKLTIPFVKQVLAL